MATITDHQVNIHDKLLEAIGEVDRPSAVCTSGDLPLTMPGLEVGELGSVSLPLGKMQARKLIKQCRQAYAWRIRSHHKVPDKHTIL